MMVFELVASSLITELKDFINFNRSKQIITETIIKRRNILSLLLKINDNNDLTDFDKNEHVNILYNVKILRYLKLFQIISKLKGRA